MASLNMGQPYELTETKINEVIESNRIGNYAYGYLNNTGVFVVLYVGRSDNDLKERVKHGLNENNPKYKHFKYSYAYSIKDAYEKECKNYHDFNGDKGLLINKKHPDKPDDKCKCPVCGL